MQPFVIAPLDSALNRYGPVWATPDGTWLKLENVYLRRQTLLKRVGDQPIRTTTAEDCRAPKWADATVDVGASTLTFATPHTLEPGMRFWLDQGVNGFGVFTVVVAPTATTLQFYPPASTYTRGLAPIELIDGAVELYLSIQGLSAVETSRGPNQPILTAMTARQLLVFVSGSRTLANMTLASGTGSPTALNYDTWTGVNLDGEYFGTNFRNSLYRITEFGGALTATKYAPYVGEGNFVQSCRQVVTYRGRLLLFNTYEGSQIIEKTGIFIPGNTVDITIGGGTPISVPFNTSSAQTWLDVATAIKNDPLVGNALVIDEDTIAVSPHSSFPGIAYPVTAITVTGGAVPTIAVGLYSVTNYPYRVRFSQGGLALNDVSSFDATLLNDSGFDDALTGEAIVGYSVQSDLLIVFFERSIWQLQFIGNPLDPFQWIRLNNQYGAGSERGTWSWDNTSLTISQQGIVSTDGRQVERIDTPIIDRTLTVVNTTQTEPYDRQASNFRRVCMTQDFNKQLMVWAYPEQGEVPTNNPLDRQIIRNSKILFWSYLQNGWGEGSAWWTSLYNFRTVTSITIDDLIEPWENYTQPWEALGSAEDIQLIVAGHDSGRLLEISDVLQQTTDQYGKVTAFGVDMVTKFYGPFLQQGMATRIRYVDIYVRPSSDAELTVNVYADENFGKPVQSVVLKIPAEGATSDVYRCYVNAYGRTLALELVLIDPDSQPLENQLNRSEIQGMIVYAQPAGRFYNV